VGRRGAGNADWGRHRGKSWVWGFNANLVVFFGSEELELEVGGWEGALGRRREWSSLLLPTTTMAVSSYAYASLSLIGLCALAGAGVGVGSGIAMMSAAMMEEEAKAAAAAPKTSAASVAEKKISIFRGFAASN